MKKIIFVFSVFLFLVLPLKSKALVIAPFAGGTHINTNTVWRADKSPYVFDEHTCPIYIHENATLTIEPGTIIKLKSGYCFFEVVGKIKANGTPFQPVVFTSLEDNRYGGQTGSLGGVPQTGDWVGFIVNGGQVEINNALVLFAGKKTLPDPTYGQQAAFYLKSGYLNPGQIKLSSSTLKYNNQVLAIDSEVVGQVEVNNCFFEKNSLAIDNQSSSLLVKAENNWWGHITGPYHSILNPYGQGQIIKGLVDFDPWQGKSLLPEPVLIVPGIMGSYLYNQDGDEVWPNVLRAILSSDDSYLNQLAMTKNGYSLQEIFAPNIIQALAGKDFWQTLIQDLRAQYYLDNINLFVFPYDWRLDINWLAGDPPVQANNLKDKIEQIKNQTGKEKINIIAHSMGGLIVKKYLQKYGSSSIDKFIDIATPHLGSPKAFKILSYGDYMGIKFLFDTGLNPARVQFISQNMPAVYELLPSQDYFLPNNRDYRSFIADIYDFDQNGVKGNLNYEQSKEFIINTGRNPQLLALAQDFHSTLDSFQPQSQGIKTYNIVGCGVATINRVYILNKEKTGGYEYALNYTSGDATVPLRSAEAMKQPLVYVRDTEHAFLPSDQGVRQLVAAILKDNLANFNFASYHSLDTSNQNCQISGVEVSYHSPIDLHIYDKDGHHLGKKDNGDLENQIPLAQFDIIDNNQFAFLPSNQQYLIAGQATATGTFNMRLRFIQNGQEEKLFYWREIKIASSTKTSLSLSTTSPEAVSNLFLAVDYDGDGQADEQIEPTSVLGQQECQDTTKPSTNLIIEADKNSQGNYLAPATIKFSAQDNTGGAGILETNYQLGTSSWQVYSQPIVLPKSGVYNLAYFSVDRAGNEEIIKTATITLEQAQTKITVEQIIEKIKNYYQAVLIKSRWVEKNLIWRLKSIGRQIKKYNKLKEKNQQRKHKQHLKLLKKIIIWRLHGFKQSLSWCYKFGFLANSAYKQLENDIENLEEFFD